MASDEMYELRVFRGGRQLRNDTFVTALDLGDVIATRDLLNRHVIGAALRAGGRSGEFHEFALEVRSADGRGQGYGDSLFRWALPAAPEGRWVP